MVSALVIAVLVAYGVKSIAATEASTAVKRVLLAVSCVVTLAANAVTLVALSVKSTTLSQAEFEYIFSKLPSYQRSPLTAPVGVLVPSNSVGLFVFVVVSAESSSPTDVPTQLLKVD